ncbi:MAG: PspA/IM30 family protein [Planctomycetaceae bacterium]|nr:PspA/IM30 family protein [Planctomycetaceae bacterium]
MPYFSRLTDIVTCSLTALLNESENPQETLSEIVKEMEHGLAGAQRSVETARKNQERLQSEATRAEEEARQFETEALDCLKVGDENGARTALYRKKEAADLAAGLDQQIAVARSTFEALMTTYRALEARLAEARRKQTEYGGADSTPDDDVLTAPARQLRKSEVEEELAILKKQLGQS